jgi:hypothetical protein
MIRNQPDTFALLLGNETGQPGQFVGDPMADDNGGAPALARKLSDPIAILFSYWLESNG